MSPPEPELKLNLDVTAFDEWARSARLLVSQVGFALDNYLASRPSLDAGGNSVYTEDMTNTQQAQFPTIPGRPANRGETEDEYIERTMHENSVTESAYPAHGSTE